MSAVLSPLSRTVNIWMGTRTDWGINDCALSVCDWVASRTGIDPGRDIRGTYDSAGSCQRQTGFLLDPVPVVTTLAEDIAGLKRTTDAGPGDVVLFKAPWRDGRVLPVLGIAVGRGMVAAKAEGFGAIIVKVPRPMRCWRVEAISA